MNQLAWLRAHPEIPFNEDEVGQLDAEGKLRGHHLCARGRRGRWHQGGWLSSRHIHGIPLLSLMAAHSPPSCLHVRRSAHIGNIEHWRLRLLAWLVEERADWVDAHKNKRFRRVYD
jgi:hypothetical protein